MNEFKCFCQGFPFFSYKVFLQCLQDLPVHFSCKLFMQVFFVSFACKLFCKFFPLVFPFAFPVNISTKFSPYVFQKVFSVVQDSFIRTFPVLFCFSCLHCEMRFLPFYNSSYRSNIRGLFVYKVTATTLPPFY